MKERILLLTKNYPPQIGGIEKYSFDLYNRLVKEGNTVFLIAAGPRNEWLLTRKGTGKGIASKFWKILYVVSELWRLGMFAIKCFTLGLYYAFRSSIIWSLDGSIAGIGLVLGKLIEKKTRVTIHGTDIVWNNRLYQKIIPKLIGRSDEIYAISQNTLQECLNRGIPHNLISLVPHTVETISFYDPGVFDKYDFLHSLGVTNADNKIILFSIGRWIERKGFHWFLENVLTELDPQKFHYILAGFGPFEAKYRQIILQNNLHNITLTGKIDEYVKACFFVTSDYFIMPNIFIQGDVEGFGLVLLEADYYGLPCLAADADGIGGHINLKKDILLGSGDKDKWLDFIKNITR